MHWRPLRRVTYVMADAVFQVAIRPRPRKKWHLVKMRPCVCVYACTSAARYKRTHVETQQLHK